MSGRPVILDVDPGVDDALAMGLALGSPELEVLGISTVSGNVPLATGTRNALGVLTLLGRPDVPVFPGAERPLAREPVYAREVHGPDGMGAAALPDPEAGPAGESADFLVETLRGRPGEVSLVATGPLTNLALAEARSPGVLSCAHRVIVMGGAIAEPGNVTPGAEFNFYVDPDAAHRVFASGAPLVLVPLDVTHRVGLDAAAIRERIEPVGTAVARFVAAAVRTAVAFSERVYGYAGFYLHDPLAVGLAVDATLCRTERVFLDVETEGRLTAGQVVADRRPFRDAALRKGFPVSCAVEVDVARFLEMFLARTLY